MGSGTTEEASPSPSPTEVSDFHTTKQTTNAPDGSTRKDEGQAREPQAPSAPDDSTAETLHDDSNQKDSHHVTGDSASEEATKVTHKRKSPPESVPSPPASKLPCTLWSRDVWNDMTKVTAVRQIPTTQGIIATAEREPWPHWKVVERKRPQCNEGHFGVQVVERPKYPAYGTVRNIHKELTPPKRITKLPSSYKVTLRASPGTALKYIKFFQQRLCFTANLSADDEIVDGQKPKRFDIVTEIDGQTLEHLTPTQVQVLLVTPAGKHQRTLTLRPFDKPVLWLPTSSRSPTATTQQKPVEVIDLAQLESDEGMEDVGPEAYNHDEEVLSSDDDSYEREVKSKKKKSMAPALDDDSSVEREREFKKKFFSALDDHSSKGDDDSDFSIEQAQDDDDEMLLSAVTDPELPSQQTKASVNKPVMPPVPHSKTHQQPARSQQTAHSQQPQRPIQAYPFAMQNPQYLAHVPMHANINQHFLWTQQMGGNYAGSNVLWNAMNSGMRPPPPPGPPPPRPPPPPPPPLPQALSQNAPNTSGRQTNPQDGAPHVPVAQNVNPQIQFKVEYYNATVPVRAGGLGIKVIQNEAKQIAFDCLRGDSPHPAQGVFRRKDDIIVGVDGVGTLLSTPEEVLQMLKNNEGKSHRVLRMSTKTPFHAFRRPSS